jgi:hypothetical protein
MRCTTCRGASPRSPMRLLATHGTEMAEEFLERTLSAVTASALAVLGRERVCWLLTQQLSMAEEWEAISGR